MSPRVRARVAGVVMLAAVVAPADARWWDPPPATPPPAVSPTPSPSPPATTRPACEIDVLEQEPAVPFDLVAYVEVQGRAPRGDAADLLASARTRACQLGGDALVILWRAEEKRSGIVAAPTTRGLLPEPGLRAAVIRYR